MTRAELIAALERADGPSRELDAHLHEADSVAPDWKRWIVGGEPFGHIDNRVPLYTARADAKLPWEDNGWWEINGPRRYLHIPSPSPNYWRASFAPWRGEARQWVEHVGWGATEALARRIAALKAQDAS